MNIAGSLFSLSLYNSMREENDNSRNKGTEGRDRSTTEQSDTDVGRQEKLSSKKEPQKTRVPKKKTRKRNEEEVLMMASEL